MYHRYNNSLTLLALAFTLLAVSCTETFDSHQSNYPLAEDQGLNG